MHDTVALTPPSVMRSEQFRADNVTIILEWSQDNYGTLSYHVSVTPQVDIRFTGSTSVQLTVSYNILYNVSVVATLCGLSLIHI